MLVVISLLPAVLLLCPAEVNAMGCTGERKLLTGLQGRFKSPDRAENGTCLWSINVPPQFRIIFYFISYDINNCYDEKNCVDCTSVVLRDKLSGPPGYRMCERLMPPPVESNGSSLFIDFILGKDEIPSRRSSFIAEYTTSTFEATVDLRKTSSVVISSPNFPGKYPRNSFYRWSIKAPSGYRIEIRFSKFDVYSGGDDCLNDFLLVFDGPSKESTLLGRYCNADRTGAVHSSGEHVWVEFVSSPEANSNLPDSEGFKATVTKEIRLYMILVPCVLGILILTLVAAAVVFFMRRRRRPPPFTSPVMKMSLLSEDDSVGNTQISDTATSGDVSLQPIQPVYRPTTQSINS